MPAPDPKLDHLVRTAIEETRLLRLRYRNKDRVVEPHDYGQHNGVIKLLTWQVDGSSSGPLPNWRWMELDQIFDAQMLDQTFAGGRPTPSSKHHKWDKLFLRVKPRSNKPN
jgi:predicted DNA-binding transcriptional regulator YafY